jgi:hypothetical protein
MEDSTGVIISNGSALKLYSSTKIPESCLVMNSVQKALEGYYELARVWQHYDLRQVP